MPRNKAKEPREDVDFENFGEGDAKKPGHGVCFYVNKNGLPLDSNTWQRMWDYVSDVHPDGALIQYRIGHEPSLPEVSACLGSCTYNQYIKRTIRLEPEPDICNSLKPAENVGLRIGCSP